MLCDGVVPSKISGVGTNFGLLVHVLPGPNKQRAPKTKHAFELNLETKQCSRYSFRKFIFL